MIELLQSVALFIWGIVAVVFGALWLMGATAAWIDVEDDQVQSATAFFLFWVPACASLLYTGYFLLGTVFS